MLLCANFEHKSSTVEEELLWRRWINRPETSIVVFLSFIWKINDFFSCVFVHKVQELKPTISQMVDYIVHTIILCISPGTYPDNPELTQKYRKDTPQYPIPDNYIVETEFSGRNISFWTSTIWVRYITWGQQSNYIAEFNKLNNDFEARLKRWRRNVYKLLYPQ